jgi:hypothetical protein
MIWTPSQDLMRASALRACSILGILVCGCYPASMATTSRESAASDSTAALRLFEENIDAIHKRDRARYLATYFQAPTLARNGPGGLQLGYADWSARRDTTWPDTLRASNLRVVPLRPGVVYGTYCYTVTQKDTTTSGVSERVFIKTDSGWRIAVTTAFGLPVGAPAQCR